MKIRVLEVLATLRRAGAERMVVSLAAGLDPSRFDARVVSLYDAFPGGFEELLKRDGIRVEHLGKSKGLDLRMIPRLIRVLREFRPHIIHTHSYVLRYVLPAHLVMSSGTLVHTVHNVALREVDWLGRMIHRAAFRMGVVPVAVAEEVARSFRDVYGFTTTATIPNGIDTSLYGKRTVGERWRSVNGFPQDSRLAVSVARLDAQKNPMGLCEAFSAALREDTRWQLLLVGDGALRDEVLDCTRRLGLEGRIRLIGVRPDVPELLSAADLFVLASNWEGNPMAVMEAMAAGLPVVATAVGGVPGVVEHGVTGLLMEAGDMAAFAAALGSLAEDPARLGAFREAALKRAKGFDVKPMIESYAGLFERVVEES